MNVHVFGETGTGKERVALRAARAVAARARPFVPLNAAGIGDELLPSELFGYARGAYTGAAVTRDGYIAAAEGGTLFIDEVGRAAPLAPGAASALPAGGRVPARSARRLVRKANVRVVSATNVDLPRRVAAGRFREDLWYRLNVDTPRRAAAARAGERRAAAGPALSRGRGADAGVESPRLSSEAEAALLAYAWRGNVRELEHEMQRARRARRAGQGGVARGSSRSTSARRHVQAGR